MAVVRGLGAGGGTSPTASTCVDVDVDDENPDGCVCNNGPCCRLCASEERMAVVLLLSLFAVVPFKVNGAAVEGARENSAASSTSYAVALARCECLASEP